MVKEKEARTRVNGAIFEGAPDWYDTPLDELDFEWSPEEKLEIERYCEKILKKIAESGDEMTPKERFEATMAGKPKDRQLILLPYGNAYLAKLLDSGADAIKPADIMRTPKLYVKAHLAYLARFTPDLPQHMNTCYSGIGLFGGRAKMPEYAQPVMVDFPIKSIADLEGLESPDPRKDGMFPGYLWSCRELKRIFDEYGLSKVMAIWSSMCPGPFEVVMEGMTGWTPFLKALRTDPELCKQATAFGLEWEIKFGKAIIELSRPEIIQCCQCNGCFPLKGNEWTADSWVDLGKALKAFSPQTHLTNIGTGFSGFDKFTDVMIERGATGPDIWNGALCMSEAASMEKLVDYYREHNLFFCTGISTKVLEEGPISAIEEECKKLCEYSKSHPKFTAAAFPAGSFWTPFEHLDAAVAALKKYGKY